MEDSFDRQDFSQTGTVVAVCASPGGIPKHPMRRAEVTADGLAGDGHDHDKHCRPDRAVSVQDIELLHQLVAEGYSVGPGVMGENVTVQDVHVQTLSVRDRLHFENGPVLELTCVRKPCFVLDAIHPDLKEIVVGRCGFLCRVAKMGTLSPGQLVTVERCNAL